MFIVAIKDITDDLFVLDQKKRSKSRKKRSKGGKKKPKSDDIEVTELFCKIVESYVDVKGLSIHSYTKE